MGYVEIIIRYTEPIDDVIVFGIFLVVCPSLRLAVVLSEGMV